eukprot:s1169_g16.t4
MLVAHLKSSSKPVNYGDFGPCLSSKSREGTVLSTASGKFGGATRAPGSGEASRSLTAALKPCADAGYAGLMPLVNAGAAVATAAGAAAGAAAGVAAGAAGKAAGAASGAANAAVGVAAGAASAVSSGVAATAALSAKVAPAPSDAASFACEMGHAAGEKLVTAGQMVKGAAGEVKDITSGLAEQAASHASGAVEGVIEQAAKQKQRMEKLADHFKELLEGFMKRKLHRVLKILATDDTEMPRKVKRVKDAAIDAIWPDIEQEIMWELAMKIDGAYTDEYPEDTLKHEELLFTLVALLPVYGVSPCVFLIIFLLIDKTDEFQLVSFILQFKGFQFLTQGVLRSLVGFFTYLNCVTAVAEAEHKCANSGPGANLLGIDRLVIGGQGRDLGIGSSAPMAIALVGYVLQIALVWNNAAIKIRDHIETGSSRSRGGYILRLLWYDLFSFAICAGTFVYVLYLRNWQLQDWPTKHAFFAVQIVNGILSFPFFFFMVPILRSVLLHSVPTAYDRFGRCRQYRGPPRPAKESKEGKSIPTQMLEKAEALRILERLKTLLSGGTVTALDEEPAGVATQQWLVCAPPPAKGTSEKVGRGSHELKVFANHNTYSGTWSDGRMHGDGLYVWIDGTEYAGEFRDGYAWGQGEKKWANGRTYSGEWVRDMMWGNGEMTWPSGDKYTGQFCKGVFHGRGTRSWANGDRYTGDFVHGEQEGDGSFENAEEGWTYIGHWVHGSMCGDGQMTWPDGVVYVGEWMDGVRNGTGRLTWPDGASYQGQFISGRVEGQGKKTLPDGSWFEGAFKEGEFEGHGTFHFADSTEFEGLWHKSAVVGPGTHRFPDGTSISGVFESRGARGEGTKTWAQGCTYAGRLLHNQIHHYGVLKWPDGRCYVGHFKDEALHGVGMLNWNDETGACSYKGYFEENLFHGHASMHMHLRHAAKCNGLHSLLSSLGQASESAMTCCFGGRMAKVSTKAYQDLMEAERALASASNGDSCTECRHENLDGRPLADAAERSEEARQYLDPLTDRGPQDTLNEKGQIDIEEVESVQSANTRTDFPSPPGEGSMLPLLPVSILAGRMFAAPPVGPADFL